MTLFGKVEIDVEISAAASKFHEMLHKRPHHISNVSTNKIQGVELHKGEWGDVGSIICWNYFLDGKQAVTKEIIEAVDEENNLIVFKVIEGDILKHYKSFKFIVQCIPKDKRSVVHWTLQYEKLHDKIPDSHSSLLQFVADVSKDIDAHLMEGSQQPYANVAVAARA